MNNHKKPISIIINIILFSLILFFHLALIILFFMKNKTNFLILFFNIGGSFVFIMGLIGLISGKKWGQIYASVLLGFFICIIILSIFYFGFIRKTFRPNLIVYIPIIGILIWNFMMLVFGTKSREYFKNKDDS